MQIVRDGYFLSCHLGIPGRSFSPCPSRWQSSALAERYAVTPRSHVASLPFPCCLVFSNSHVVAFLIFTNSPQISPCCGVVLPFLPVVSQSLAQTSLLVQSFVVLKTTGSDPVPNLKASLVGRAHLHPSRTARSARRSIRQRSGSSSGLAAVA
jgi:hypothetical protein